MVRPRLTIYVCQESQQLRDLQQKHEDGDAVTSTFFGIWGGRRDGLGQSSLPVMLRAPAEASPRPRSASVLIN